MDRFKRFTYEDEYDYREAEYEKAELLTTKIHEDPFLLYERRSGKEVTLRQNRSAEVVSTSQTRSCHRVKLFRPIALLVALPEAWS